MFRYFKRIMYLGYYYKQLDKKKYKKFLSYASNKVQRTKTSLLFSSIYDSIKYNIGLIDYFIFSFYQKDNNEKAKWVGTGYKYEYDLKMNPRNTRNVLENKIDFYNKYNKFIKHAYCTIKDIEKRTSRAKEVIENKTGKIVVKNSLGQCGWDVEIVDARKFDYISLTDYMKTKNFNLAEEFIVQHKKMNSLSPTGLNTIRVITQINREGKIDFLGARLRITVNNHVDNLASGNIAAPIDIKTGIVCGPGVYSDITKESVFLHPITKSKIVGFSVPFWDEILDKTEKIALHYPLNKGVGWDVAVTEEGPDFIEGNHNWCKILWQLPINEGKKDVLLKYLNDL